MRRWLAGALALALAIAALLLALGGTLNRTSGGDARIAAATRPARHVHRHTTSGPSAPSTGEAAPNSPGELALIRSLRRVLSAAGSGAGALVFDISTGRVLFALDPTVARAPASVEKIWTTVALLDRLGPGARLQTTMLGTGRLVHGVWHGDLFLRGGGDPTFGDAQFNSVWNNGQGPTAAELAGELRARGIRRVTGRLYADPSLFDNLRGGLITNQKPDIPDLGGELSALTYDHGSTVPHYNPATFTAHEVALTMRASHIQVLASTQTRRTPDDAQALATVSSPPILAMTKLMDVPSDDFFAEMFTKQLGAVFGSGGTIAAGAKVIAHTIATGYGLRPRILDGSGLSRGDRTSPVQIVDLLRELSGTATGAELAESLPVTGVSGTVASIGAHSPAQGRCQAKTGSLNYITNLAGYCETRSGQKLAFGLFIDGPGNAIGFEMASRMVGAIARY